MSANTKKQRAYQLGHHAETLAAFYLQCKGYRVLAKRMRNHAGEIDIVAQKKDYLIAVEVKARASRTECLHSITPEKRQRMAGALALFAAQHKIAGLAPHATPNMRLDVIAIAPRNWPTHIKDAF